MIILFGGGDAGGIEILPDGTIRKIPPYDPGILRELKILSKLTAAAGGLEERRPLGELAASVASEIVPRAVEATGSSREGGLLFLDWDDGLFCGNILRPIPIPLPGPLTQGALVREVAASA